MRLCILLTVHMMSQPQLVQEVESQRERAISLSGEQIKVKRVSKWEVFTSPHLLLIDEEHLAPGNPPH